MRLRQIKSEARRARLLRVLDGYPAVAHHIHHWNSLVRCDEILDWLIRHNITGKTLEQWCRHHFGMSFLEPAKFILGQIDHDREKRTIRVGRDYVVAS